MYWANRPLDCLLGGIQCSKSQRLRSSERTREVPLTRNPEADVFQEDGLPSTRHGRSLQRELCPPTSEGEVSRTAKELNRNAASAHPKTLMWTAQPLVESVPLRQWRSESSCRLQGNVWGTPRPGCGFVHPFACDELIWKHRQSRKKRACNETSVEPLNSRVFPISRL